MKSIELTKKHKAKLLEMCNKLFKKEIHGLTIQEDNGFLNYSDTSKTVDYDDRIHWFEFCMTHLAEKIDCDLAHNIIYMKKHPIDYLYEEFKKLKL